MNLASLSGHIIELLRETDRGSAPADRIAERFFRERKYCGSRDRRFISEKLFGIIRNRRYLEALLEEYIAEYPAAVEMDSPQVRYLPLLAAYQAVFTPDQPPLPSMYWKTYLPTTDLDRFLDWIRGHSDLGFLPADAIIRLGVRYSFQDWMTEEWHELLGTETEALLRTLNTPAPVTLRVNTLRTTRETCRARLQEEGIETDVTTYSPDGLNAGKRFQSQSSPAFRDGWFEMQDEGSQLITMIAEPEPGQTVIDAAAGAGGKTLHIAAMMHNSGTIHAMDIDPRRLRALNVRAERAGVSIIRPMAAGGQDANISADLVLVDAPCSGIGTIRRSPWIKWNVRQSTVDHYTHRQKEILDSNVSFVRPGGKLVYSTCSLLHSENEGIVISFLTNHPDFHPVRFRVPGPRTGTDAEGWTTLYPHRFGTDGFFIAVLRRDQ